MHVSLDGGENQRSLAATVGFIHFGLKISDGGFHHPGRIEHRGQLHLARAKQIADSLHAVEQHGVNEVERRVGRECHVQSLFQRLFLVALPNRPLAANDKLLQFLLDGKAFDCNFFFLCNGACVQAGEIGHVKLQGVARAAVLKDELASQFDFFFWNFIERVNLRVIDDGRIEAAVDGLFEENGIQHTARVGLQTKRNIGDAEHGATIGSSSLMQTSLSGSVTSRRAPTQSARSSPPPRVAR